MSTTIGAGAEEEYSDGTTALASGSMEGAVAGVRVPSASNVRFK